MFDHQSEYKLGWYSLHFYCVIRLSKECAQCLFRSIYPPNSFILVKFSISHGAVATTMQIETPPPASLFSNTLETLCLSSLLTEQVCLVFWVATYPSQYVYLPPLASWFHPGKPFQLNGLCYYECFALDSLNTSVQLMLPHGGTRTSVSRCNLGLYLWNEKKFGSIKCHLCNS